jgi:hypothetical protein
MFYTIATSFARLPSTSQFYRRMIDHLGKEELTCKAFNFGGKV